MVPIYLSEAAPPAFRATYGGLVYQLGNMAASSASQIEATAGSRWKKDGHDDYAKIMGVLIGVTIAWLMLCTFAGPEADGVHFEDAAIATESGAGAAALRDVADKQAKHKTEHLEYTEKPTVDHKEEV